MRAYVRVRGDARMRMRWWVWIYICVYVCMYVCLMAKALTTMRCSCYMLRIKTKSGESIYCLNKNIVISRYKECWAVES